MLNERSLTRQTQTQTQQTYVTKRTEKVTKNTKVHNGEEKTQRCIVVRKKHKGA